MATAKEGTNLPEEQRLDRAQVPGLRPHVPVEDRMRMGQDRRHVVPWTSLATWKPPADRPDPVDILTGQDANRLSDLVPIRYGRMLESPFAFYRGAAAIMASDLSYGPRTDLSVQLAGDAHLDNFGAYGTAERTLVFDVNDFDETLPGPFEWDLKRLAASVVVAGRNNGFSKPDCSDAAMATMTSYRQRMAIYAQIGYLSLYYTFLDVEQLLEVVSGRSKRRAKKAAKKARSRDNLQALSKMCQVDDGQIRIIDDPPILTHVDDWRELGAERGARLFRTYFQSIHPDRRDLLERYSLVDATRKVVGVGSVGTRCYVLLFKGASENDPLFLQIKEANASVLEALSRREHVQASQRARGRRPADHPGHQRRVPRLGHDQPGTLLSASASRHERRGRCPDHAARWPDRIRGGLRLGTGSGARALRRRGRDQRLPGPRRRL